jgi:tetratricopeptide (TPR) repeat protein
VQNLVAYIEGHLDELVDDLLLSLREADAAFRDEDPTRVQMGMRAGLWHFTLFAEARDPAQLDAAYDMLVGIWSARRVRPSLIIRAIFLFEDLVAIRAQPFYPSPDDFIDAIRAFRAVTREVLAVLCDRLLGVRPAAGQSQGGPAVTVDDRSQQGRAEQVDTRALAERLARVRPVGRSEELRQVWARLRVVTSQEGGHQVVGIKAPDGLGKSTLVTTFLDRVERQIDGPPAVLRIRVPRLFVLPSWPVAALVREAFGLTLGDADGAERVRRGLGELTGLAPRLPVDHEALVDGAPHLARLLGLGGEGWGPADTGRAGRVGRRRALVSLFEALSLRARQQTRGPLFVVIEDAGEMDAPSWDILRHLLDRVRPVAPLMVLLTYDARFNVPAGMMRTPSFTEVLLQPFDMNDGEQLIDGLLAHNQLEEQTRLRLHAATQSSPLLLHEAIRQLVHDGVVGLEGDRWVEIGRLPDGEIGDLSAIVARRRALLSPLAADVLEVLSVIEDTADAEVFAAMLDRRVDHEQRLAAVEELMDFGFVESALVFGLPVPVCRHPLIRDEIYRQMSVERRRALHESAGEIFATLPGGRAFPSLAAGHYALARRPLLALEGLIEGIDRCLETQSLQGALDLCSQALGLLGSAPREEQDELNYRVLRRRERVYALLGHHDLRRADLTQLDALVDRAGEPGDREALALRRAAMALIAGDHPGAEEHLLDQLNTDDPARRARVHLALALNGWQQGRLDETRVFIEDALRDIDALPDGRKGRLHLVHGRLHAASGQLAEALHAFFECWRCHRRAGDLLGEGLAIAEIAEIYWTRGRLLDADALLRHADALLDEVEEPRARVRVLLRLAQLHALFGDFDEAGELFSEVLRHVDKQRDRRLHAEAIIGQGRILVHRGRLEEATSLLGMCLKELGGRKAVREPLYIDTQLALAQNLAMSARGQKLIGGGLRYAVEAAEQAIAIGHHEGLVRALVVQLRGLMVLDRGQEAFEQLPELLDATRRALAVQPRLARLITEVELCRSLVYRSIGDHDRAEAAMERAWRELSAQLGCLRGSGYEHGFLTNIIPHREIITAIGPRPELEGIGLDA